MDFYSFLPNGHKWTLLHLVATISHSFHWVRKQWADRWPCLRSDDRKDVEVSQEGLYLRQVETVETLIVTIAFMN